MIAQIESDDGSILAVMHTALCLALMDAGLPLRGMFAGVACAQLEDGELCWDPTADDEVERDCTLTLIVFSRYLCFLRLFIRYPLIKDYFNA